MNAAASAVLVGLCLVLAGCGKKSGSGGAPAVPPAAPVAPALSLDGNWTVVKKSCMGMNIEVTPNEAYSISGHIFAHVILEEQSSAHFCKRALASQRVLLSSSFVEGVSISETFILRQTHVRDVCYAKTAGIMATSAYKDETKEIQETLMSGDLKATPEGMVLNVKGAKECPSGVLTFDLKKG